MKEFMDFNVDDARQYWNETWVGIEGEGHVKAYYVDYLSEDEGDIMFRVYRDERAAHIHLNDPKLISYVPELGMKQVGNQACYLTKAAARQWKKGLRNGQFTSKFINYEAAQFHNCSIRGMATEDRDGLFNKTHCLLEDALQMLPDHYSVALSSNFALARHPRSHEPVLNHRHELVGKVIKGELYLLKEYSELIGTLTDEVGECHVM
jgi:hypothetical protein